MFSLAEHGIFSEQKLKNHQKFGDFRFFLYLCIRINKNKRIMEQNNLTVREIMNLTGIPNMEGTVVMFDYTDTTTDTTSTINNITSNNTKTFVVIGMIERYRIT